LLHPAQAPSGRFWPVGAFLCGKLPAFLAVDRWLGLFLPPARAPVFLLQQSE